MYRAYLAARLLTQILSSPDPDEATRIPPISWPVISAGRQIPADLYVSPSPVLPLPSGEMEHPPGRRVGVRGRPGVVVVHGAIPDGKDDPRLQHLCRALARAGFVVLVPDIAALKAARLDPAMADEVAAAAASLTGATGRPVGLVGVSIGAGPVLMAAARPELRERVAFILTIGGYASLRSVLETALATPTTALAPEMAEAREEMRRMLIEANADLLGETADRLRRDPGRIPRWEDMPAALRNAAEALSPEGGIASLRAPLFLAHSETDPVIAPAESRRLYDAARRAGIPARLVTFRLFSHVDRAGPPRPADLWRVFSLLYSVLSFL